jgi:hypothetical protein
MRLIRYQAQAVRSRDNARDKFDEQHADKLKKRKFEESDPELLRDIKEENDPRFTSVWLKEEPWDTLQAAVASGNETERAAAFEKALDVYEKIDYLINQSVKRTNEILGQIESYRSSLAERLRKKQQMTVEALKSELAEKRVDPPLIPEVDRNQ